MTPDPLPRNLIKYAMQYVEAHKATIEAYRRRARFRCDSASDPEPEVGDPGVAPCYRRGLEASLWCETCLEREEHHVTYRKAAKARKASIRRLQSIARIPQ